MRILVRSAGLFAQLVIIAAGLSCAAQAPVRHGGEPEAIPSGTSVLDNTCKYVRFVLATDATGFVRSDELADVALTREVELLYAEEFERVGFRRLPTEAGAWLYLRANLMRSPVRPDNLVGAVELASTSHLHRDYSLALMSGEVPEGPMGTLIATEIATQQGTVRFRDGVRADARKVAQWAWGISTPALGGLCTWETQVINEGVTIEELRKELVAEMVRVRQASREEKQRKELKVNIEE